MSIRTNIFINIRIIILDSSKISKVDVLHYIDLYLELLG